MQSNKLKKKKMFLNMKALTKRKSPESLSMRIINMCPGGLLTIKLPSP